MATYASLKYDFGTQLTGAIPTAAIADDAITLAKMAGGTDGNLIGFDASGDPAAIATGTAGQVLTSAGANAASAMADAAGGGKVVQYVNFDDSTSMQYSNSTTFVATTNVCSITPTSAGNKIFVQVSFNNNYVTSGGQNDIGGRFAVYRDIDGGGYSVNWTMNYCYDKYGDSTSNEKHLGNVMYCSYLDTPNTTDEVSYKVYWRVEWAASTHYTKNGGRNSISLMEMDT
jgi:hypothetical protein